MSAPRLQTRSGRKESMTLEELKEKIRKWVNFIPVEEAILLIEEYERAKQYEDKHGIQSP